LAHSIARGCGIRKRSTRFRLRALGMWKGWW